MLKMFTDDDFQDIRESIRQEHPTLSEEDLHFLASETMSVAVNLHHLSSKENSKRTPKRLIH
jgi:hypothetical protein